VWSLAVYPVLERPDAEECNLLAGEATDADAVLSGWREGDEVCQAAVVAGTTPEAGPYRAVEPPEHGGGLSSRADQSVMQGVSPLLLDRFMHIH